MACPGRQCLSAGAVLDTADTGLALWRVLLLAVAGYCQSAATATGGNRAGSSLAATQPSPAASQSCQQRRLGMPAQLPMAKLAEYIIEIHPGADPDKIRSLLSELEAALFAGHEMRDFKTWKKEFKRQVRPRLFASLRHRRRAVHATGLPRLNPIAS